MKISLAFSRVTWQSCFAGALFLWCIAGIKVPTIQAASWSNVASPVSKDLYGIWGSSATSLTAVGDGVVIRYNGAGWTTVSGLCANYRAVSGTDVNHIVVAGQGGGLARYDAAKGSLNWYKDPAWVGGDVIALSAIDATNYVAVGVSWANAPRTASTPIRRMIGGAWQSVPDDSSLIDTGWKFQTVLNAVWGSSASDIWAGGRDETGGNIVLHWTGSGTWKTVAQLTSEPPIQAMWGSGSNNIWAVGGDGTTRKIYHFIDNSWSVVGTYTGVLGQMPHAMWGSGANDIWIAGENAQGNSIQQYDGTSWRVVTGPTRNSTEAIRSLWGTSSSDVWAVGTGGNIFHYGSPATVSGALTGSSDCGSTAPELIAVANPGKIVNPGGVVQISWSTANADTLTVNGERKTPVASGSTQYWVSGNATFRVQACATSNGQCATRDIAVPMVDSLTATLTADPATSSLPVATTTLHMTVGGTASGSVLYTIYCDRGVSGTGTTSHDTQITSNSTSLDYTGCDYTQVGIYRPQVVIQRGTALPATAQITVTRSNQVLSVTLSASSTSGQAPLSTVLTATVSGNAQGTINFSFYCNRNDTATSPIDTGSPVKYDNQPAGTLTFSTAASDCQPIYSQPGTYTAKVIIEQGNAPAATALLPIAVTPASSFGVGVSMNPSVGAAPLTNVRLTARLKVGYTDTVTYYFWCAKNLANTSIPSDYTGQPVVSKTGSATGPSCNYPNQQTYNPRVVAVAADGRMAYVVSSITPLSSVLSTTLTASPNSGGAPLKNVYLQAKVYGSENASTINYTFYCSIDPTTADATQTNPAAMTAPVSVKYTNIPASGSPPSYRTQIACPAYTTPGTYTAKVIVERGSSPATTALATILVTAKALSVTLNATPYVGAAPLTGTVLTATVGGNATGLIDYSFYCDNADPSPTVTPAAAETITGSTSGSAASSSCDYLGTYHQEGNYTAKVVVIRDGLVAAASLPISVTPHIIGAPSISLMAEGSKNPTVNLGQTISFTWSSGLDTSAITSTSPNLSLSVSPDAVNCSANCASVTMTTLGNTIFWIEVIGPLGTVVRDQVTVGVVRPTSTGQSVDYNYGRGGGT